MIKKIYKKGQLFTANLLAKPENKPLFILGNEKSGTTVIGASLAQAVGKSVTLDIPGTWDPIQSQLYNEKISLEKVISKNKVAFSREIIKEPVLTFEYNKLVKHYKENAKFVLIIRDPRDNIRSILNRLKLPGNLEDLTDKEINGLGKLWNTWNTVLYNKWMGAEYSNYIESMAVRWNIAADVFLKNQQNVILFKYEDFMKDKVTSIHELAEKLGLEVKNDIAKRVNTQFQSKGNNKIKLDVFFGTENLKSINSICKERMEKFGYVVESDL